MSFDDDLKAAQAGSRLTADVPVTLNGKRHVLRFTQMNGIEWAAESVRHPARPDVLLDARFGYNLHSLAQAVAPTCGALVNGDGTEPLSEEVWGTLFSTLDGSDVQGIIDAIFGLNERATAQAVAAAKKAVRGSRKSSS